MLIAGGSTNVTTYFAMRLAADGTAATGLTIANIDLQYVRSGVAPVAKVDAVALAATDTAHTDNRAIEIDATDQPGLYRVDWPDAAFAAGVREVILSVKVATAFTEHLRCEIDGEVTAEALGTQAKADVNAEVDTALSDYGANTTTPLTAAQVNAEVDTALVDIHLDHLMAAAAADVVVDGSVIAHLVSATEDWSTFVPSDDSLQAIRDRGDSAWITGAGGSDRLVLADTTIATLASQVSFTLTAGSADNDAYNNCTIVVEDVSTATQKAIGMVLDYVGSTKTVTLKEALAFTIAATDKVYILAENSLKSTVANRQLDVTPTGAAGIDWANVENPTTVLDLSATDIQLVDTTTTNTDMVGTDGANTTTPPTAAAIVNEWESQSQSDPTGFHVNVKEVNGTAQTAGDIAALVVTADAAIDVAVADLANGTDGLGALKTLIDTVNTDLSNGTDGLGALKTLIDTVNTDLSNGTDGLGALKALIDTVDTVVDAIKLVTDLLNAADAEPTGVPAANETPLVKLAYTFMALRNKILISASKKQFFDDAGNVEWEKDLADDGTDYTESEANSP